MFARQPLAGQILDALAAVAPGVAQAGLHDVTQGNNGAYHAAAGWDPCTGLGSPNASALLTVLTTGTTASA